VKSCAEPPTINDSKNDLAATSGISLDSAPALRQNFKNCSKCTLHQYSVFSATFNPGATPLTFGKNMLPAALIVITICLLVWLGFEIRWARRFVSEGVSVDATVSRREWSSLGSSGRSLRITVAVQNENETKEYPIGYMSFFGFKNLQIGDTLPVLMHPSCSYVIPTGRMGVISRPFIAGSLFLASAICATAFTLSAISK
jgi:hypothetical protein